MWQKAMLTGNWDEGLPRDKRKKFGGWGSDGVCSLF